LDALENADTLLVTDFSINPARDGRQTHMEFNDLFEALPFQGREPTTTTMSRAAAKMLKRRMG
jgi:hypothetical protein